MKNYTIRLFLILVLLASIALLSSCGGGGSGKTRGDGPPARAVDLSNVQNAIPKRERQTRAGNPKSYVVFGKRYRVLRRNKGYVRRGVASWYGAKFHGRPTSNGERYNMYRMTAAHKSLRIPTYVRVRNLENGKVIVVRVNDRGPFVGNRIIDLSYAAAHKIGMLGKGTAFVQIETVEPGETDLPMIAANKKQESPLSLDAPKVSKVLPLVSQLPKFKTARPIESQKAKNSPSRTPEQRRKDYNIKQQSRQQFKITPEPKQRVIIPPKTKLALASPASSGQKTQSSMRAFIQVGAFRSRQNAKKLFTRLWKLSYPYLSIHRSYAHGRPIFRVRIGPLNTVRQLDLISNDLTKNGFRMTRVVVK